MCHLIYPIVSFNFFRVGLFVLFIFVFRRRGSIQRVKSKPRRTSPVDHVESRSTGSLITHVVKRIFKWNHPNHWLRVITAKIARDRWTHQHIAIVGSTSNRWSKLSIFFFMRWNPISTLYSRSDDHHAEATIRSTDAWSLPSIAMHPFIQRPRLILTSLTTVLRDEKNCTWNFKQFEMSRHMIHISFDSLYSWPISASKDYLKSKFDRERRKKSHLKLQFLSSKLGMKCHASGD